MSTEPVLTPSSESSIVNLLKMALLEFLSRCDVKGRKSILISSNSLANKFIYLQWGIRPSQRRQYRNLFLTVREQCRDIFQYYINQKEVIYQEHGTDHKFGVYKFDEVRGNLILGFVYTDSNSI
ncbi:MAG: hypothetical protein ACFFCT_06730 [Candidatus Odinarchaeota archaeon]